MLLYIVIMWVARFFDCLNLAKAIMHFLVEFGENKKRNAECGSNKIV